MHVLPCLALGLALATPQPRSPRVEALVLAVEPARLQTSVARLVSFGTRHTLSDTKSDTRGIGAARAWLASEFAALSKMPGSRLKPFEDRFTAEPAPRIPRSVEIVNVGAVLPGVDPSRAMEAIVLAAHYDSRAGDVMDVTSDAPGAVDDGSGVAVLLEMARVMARERPAVSVYLIAVAGEEQGLTGSAHLARRLKSEGVSVLAMIGVDTVGNSEGQDGVKDNVSARLFSEGVSRLETDAQRKFREAIGGENDGAAREWSRYVKRVAERYVENLDLWVMLRQDRIARGGDHMSFAREGFPAIRITEAHENYDRQHQDPRVEGGRSYGDDLAHFDATYAAKLTKALVAAVASLAGAPSPIRDIALGGAVSPDARLRMKFPEDPRITGLVLYRRRADGVAWQRADAYPRGNEIVVKGTVPDSFVFAVATVDAEGNESIPSPPTRLE
jgi:Zn-dependent M28 family amino/carboxypeptidase